MTPWFVRHKALYRSECDGLRHKFGFAPVPNEDGIVFRGSLRICTELGTETIPVRLRYPEDFPYSSPEVLPLRAAGPGADEAPRLFSMRHQMKDGHLCLYELPGSTGAAQMVTGVDALKRAERWLAGAVRGQFPSELDSLEADLENHYVRAGDIFLGPSMFSPKLKPGGRFIARQTRVDKYPAYVVTHVEGLQGWLDERKLELGRHLAGALPLAEDPWWNHVTSPQKLDALVLEDTLLVGRAFELIREPPPLRSLQELACELHPGMPAEEALTHFEKTFALERARAANLVIALRFPGRAGARSARDWLFLRLPLRDAPGELVRAPNSKFVAPVLDFTARKRDLELRHSLRSHDLRKRSLELRNTGRIPAKVEELKLSIFGAGALGSSCADLLVKAGVARLRIWDPSFIDAGNVIRHTAKLLAVGWPKAWATQAELTGINPHVEVRSIAHRVQDWSDASEEAPWKDDLSISTIASDAQELAINLRAVEAGATVYYLRALRRGTAARLVRVRPGQDACLECVGHYARAEDPRAILVEAAPEEIIGHECGQPVLAASAADLAITSGLGVRQVLEDSAGPGTTNQWVWTSTGMPGHPGLEAPFSMKSTTLAPHPDCAVCGPREVTTLVLPPEVREQLVARARQHAPQETGGILVGRRRGSVVEVVAASEAGPKAESTPARFVRDGEYCQHFLTEQVELHTKDPVDYVGEWHSHPGASAEPSPRDLASLEDIAQDPQYLTQCPLSLIVGLPEGHEEPELICTCHPVDGPGGRVRLTEPPGTHGTQK
jgi:integrative and conjugative element protein (TIGR02256 family)